jgi:exonuclease III
MDISLLSWNIGGAAKIRSNPLIHTLLASYAIILLQETKISTGDLNFQGYASYQTNAIPTDGQASGEPEHGHSPHSPHLFVVYILTS